MKNQEFRNKLLRIYHLDCRAQLGRFLRRAVLTVFPAMMLAEVPHHLHAAEIEFAPDLLPKLNGLLPLYNQSSGQSVEPSILGDHFSVLKISGRINAGDAKVVEEMLEEIYSFVVVLDSPGGSLQDGIEIGEYFSNSLKASDPSFNGVYVLNGSECLSACALIFALSSGARELSQADSIRFLEVGAQLGFHMGTLTKNILEQKIPLIDGMNLTYDIMAVFTKLLTVGAVPPYLLQEALRYRNDDNFYYVEASEIAFDLGFVPVSDGVLSLPLQSAFISPHDISGVCEQLLYASMLETTIVTDEYGFMVTPDMGLIDLLAHYQSDNLILGFVSGETCHIGIDQNDHFVVEVNVDRSLCSNGGDDTHGGFAYTRGPVRCTTPKAPLNVATVAMLADASGCQLGQYRRYFDEWGTLESDWYFEDFGIRDLDQTVALKEFAFALSHDVMTLPKDQTIKILDCAVVADDIPVWYEIDANGTRGWIPAHAVPKPYAIYRAKTKNTPDH